jgi:D-aminopeptidase
VHVHTESLFRPNTETSHAVNTGVTTILPRKDWFDLGSRCGIFSFNGSGEVTGCHWLKETGLLNSPIVLTNSFGVGACYDGIYKWAIREHANEAGLAQWFLLPVVGETYDGMTSDIAAMAVTPDMTVRGIDQASKERVKEGCTGGGTGMLTAGFKSGTGSASRIVNGKVRLNGKETKSEYVVGCLVQANFGKQYDLKIGGVPIGRMMMSKEKLDENEKYLNGDSSGRSSAADAKESKGPPKDGSIIIVLATSAPLSAIQLQRLAKRATVGLARVGGWGSNSSGDVFLAFSTAHGIKRNPDEGDGIFEPVVNQMVGDLQDETINGLFEAAADATEESIYNALCGAHDIVGPHGEEFKAIDQQKLKELMEKHYIRA